MKNNDEIVLFETEDKNICLEVPIKNESVWLTQSQMSELFDTARSSIAYHISNIFKESELPKDTSVEIFDKSKHDAFRPAQYYNLDVIISVGYRVKSQRGIEFRRWANGVLKDYILKGYALNNSRLSALEKTVEIQSKMLSGVIDVDSEEVLKAVNQYTKALMLLDQYDHQSIKKPKGNIPVYKLTYATCKEMIDNMEHSFKSDVFGLEREKGQLEGILGSIYQSAFGKDIYSTTEEKAANLLYFIIKDHPFADGCKRIGASLFLEFLHRNGILFCNDKQVLSDGALVATTLMIAESKPEEKDIMINIVMNLLQL